VIAAVIGLVALIIANWDTVVSWTKTAWSAVTGAIGAAWEWIKGAASAALGFLVSLFLNFTGPGLIIKHWQSIVDFTRSAWSAVTGAVSGAWNAVTGAVSSGVSSAVSWVAGMPGRLLGALGNVGSLLLGAGRSVIQGFLDGITGAFQKVKDTLGRLTSLLPDWKGPATRDAMILHSAGRLVMGGFETGLVSKFGDVQRTLGGFTDQMQGLTVRRPVGVTLPGSAATASGSAGAGTGGYEALVRADTINVIEGTPDDLARKLAVEARTALG
jgi:phage-related protein